MPTLPTISSDSPPLLELLQRREYLKQCTDIEGLAKRCAAGPVSFYVGVDPTADSLHVGHLLPILLAAYLSWYGHTPIFLIGDGTARIGDPSGKTKVRPMLTPEEITQNAHMVERQIRMLSERLSIKNAKFVRNAEWLSSIHYIDFLREIGRHFSVNQMLAFETYRTRLETGLNFIELNYQLLQSYDFLELFRHHRCELQIGGDDQWANIISGVDLIRKIERKKSWGLTIPLLVDRAGRKMGKTEKGALFLDTARTTSFDFYQYWRNIPDENVEMVLRMITFVPEQEIAELLREDINIAKERMAFEITAIAHGDDSARQVRGRFFYDRATTKALAGKYEEAIADYDKAIELNPRDAVAYKNRGAAKQALGRHEEAKQDNDKAIELNPRAEHNEDDASSRLDRSELEQGIDVMSLLVRTPFCSSRSEGRRLIQQGGVAINERPVRDITTSIDSDWLSDDFRLLVRVGKKRFHSFFTDPQ